MQRRFTLSVPKSNSAVKTRKLAHKNDTSLERPPPAASSSRSPVPTQLDRVLEKAANKHKLAHPAALPSTPPSQEPLKELAATRNTPSRKQKRSPQRSQVARKKSGAQQQRPKLDLDDDALFSAITERERDSVWQTIQQEVEGNSDDEDDTWSESGSRSQGALARRCAAPASARYDGLQSSGRATAEAIAQPVASSSDLKGFGSPSVPRSQPALSSTAQSSDPRTASGSPYTSQRPLPPSTHGQRQPQAKSQRRSQPAERTQYAQKSQHVHPSSAIATTTHPGGGKPAHPRRGALRVFLFNAEEERTRSLLVELGMAGRVEVVGDLRAADLLLAGKLTRAGKHVNLTQGERTAANAGIPFVVVGRNMSRDNLRAALEPLLELGPDEAAAVVAARAAAIRGPTAAELQAHRQEMMVGFGQLLFGDSA